MKKKLILISGSPCVGKTADRHKPEGLIEYDYEEWQSD